MDPNGNTYTNLDGSLNISGLGSLNGSMNFPGCAGNMANLQTYTTEQLLLMQQQNEQKIQQIQVQLAQMQMHGTPPTIGQYTAISPTGPMVTTGPLYSPSAPVITPNFVEQRPIGPSSFAGGSFPANVAINLNTTVPNILPNNLASTGITNSYPNSVSRIDHTVANPIYVQVPTFPNQFSGQPRTAATPNSLSLQKVNSPRANLSSGSYTSSGPSTPQDSPASTKKPQVNSFPDEPTFMQRPRQIVTSPPTFRPPPTSDRSSNSSSIPGSPASSGNPPFSPDGSLSDSFGPISPDGTPKKGVNGDMKASGSQIKNRPLQMETRYPQDKCYHCRKKVYPMEKIGPVRDVVYHKLCFKCETCNTTLNMKNVFHNQSDPYDKSVYCKSHQPLPTDKGPKLDAESFEIKSALVAPKQGTVLPESERVPVKKYSYDVTCREIEHARKAPVKDLQSGVKARSHAWSKSKRENYYEPSTEIVKHDEELPEYNADEYNRHIIESQPDY